MSGSQGNAAMENARAAYLKFKTMRDGWFCKKCGRWCPNCCGRSCDKCCVMGLIGWHHCPTQRECHCFENSMEKYFEEPVDIVRMPQWPYTPPCHIGPLFGHAERTPAGALRRQPPRQFVYELLPGQAVLRRAPGVEQRSCQRLHAPPHEQTPLALGAAPLPGKHADSHHLQVRGRGDTRGDTRRRRWDAHASHPARLGLLTRSAAFELPFVPRVPVYPPTVRSEVLETKDTTDTDFYRKMQRKHYPAFFAKDLVHAGVF